MYTRCPTCSTCFRVTDRHLAIAKGKVRCGQCQLVFNAPENAIDDLPTKQAPASPQTETKTAKVKKRDIPAPAIEAPTKTTKIEKPKQEIKPKASPVQQPIVKPAFDADATMIANTPPADNIKIKKIKLEKPTTNPDDITILDKDDVFDDSFDLDAAIDELTQATDEIKEHDETIEVEVEQEPLDDKFIPNNNDDGIFITDAYDATSASSVADILNEMEGQLSLDIEEPEDEEPYDANKEFDFLNIDNKNTEEEPQDERLTEKPEIIVEEPESENNISEEELFDQIDLTDFEESDIQEHIIVEDLSQQNIGHHADIPFQLRNDIENLQATSPRRFHPLLSVFIIVVLVVLSFSQLAYFRAHELVKALPATRPLLEAFCENINCIYSGPRDTKKIQLISRDVRLHPKEKKALLISAAMINNAYFAQPYPKIHIRLSDISGNIIAERIFNAKTYLGKLNNPFLLMKSKTPVHINFEVLDPGKDAINFEFSFL